MKVVVIGAGIAGLGAAHYFRQKGHEVQVLEASDQVGGRAISYQRPGTSDIVDVGTQYYHSSYRRTLGFVKQAGMESHLRKIRGYTRIYDDKLQKGSFLFNRYLPWYQSTGISGNLTIGYELAKTFIQNDIDPFVLDYYAKADDISVVDHQSNLAVYRSIVQPLTQVGALSEPEDMQVSLHHVHRLRHIILFTEYLSLSGGTASLHKAIAEQVPVQFETPVIHIIEEGGRIIGVQLENEAIKADHVVVAVTPPAALKIIPEQWVEAQEFLAGIQIPAFTLPTFFLDRTLEPGVWSFLF
ncbi:MAG: FAD-dependent oxidoreductase, partial [Gammaproteobacteria bacterium]|nr:FAD-dependent oxidoreductase [Gammaproteobacteria bacterium]